MEDITIQDVLQNTVSVLRLLKDIRDYGEARGKWEDGKLTHIPIGEVKPHSVPENATTGDE